MSRTIEIQFPRTLLLENAVRTKAEANDPARIHAAAVGLGRFIRAQGAVPRGPLVQVVQLDRAGGRNPPGNELLRQASAPIDAEGAEFLFIPMVEVGGCVLAKFDGDIIDLHMAYSKLAVFAYENNVALSGTFYVVLVEQEGSAMTADIFATTGED